MATIIDERAPFRGTRAGVVSLAILALLVVLVLGIWQSKPAAERAPSVDQAEEFSPEAIRVRNTAARYVPGAFSPEAVRIRNTAALYEPEAFSPEVVRIRNTSGLRESHTFSPEVVRMRNWQSLVLDYDSATK